MTPDAFGIIALVITTALVAWPHVALSRRALPRPTPSDAPPSNQGAATGQPAPDAILDNACAVPEGYSYIHVVYDSGWVTDSESNLHVSQIPWTCASCYVEVAKPAELDAIAARFDARIDAVLRARSSKEVPATGDAG